MCDENCLYCVETDKNFPIDQEIKKNYEINFK